jgi:hypothetical protein
MTKRATVLRATVVSATVPESRREKDITSQVKAMGQEQPNVGKDSQDHPMLGFLPL